MINYWLRGRKWSSNGKCYFNAVNRRMIEERSNCVKYRCQWYVKRIGFICPFCLPHLSLLCTPVESRRQRDSIFSWKRSVLTYSTAAMWVFWHHLKFTCRMFLALPTADPEVDDVGQGASPLICCPDCLQENDSQAFFLTFWPLLKQQHHKMITFTQEISKCYEKKAPKCICSSCSFYLLI